MTNRVVIPDGVVIVYGPAGCGKTTNAEALRKHFGCKRVIDEVRFSDPHAVAKLNLHYGDLVLTETDVIDLSRYSHDGTYINAAVTIPFEAAMRMVDSNKEPEKPRIKSLNHDSPQSPAFPCSLRNKTDEVFEGFAGETIAPGGRSDYSGISIRDYFAAAALQGMLSDSEIDMTPDQFCKSAYIYADAMIKARGTRS